MPQAAESAIPAAPQTVCHYPPDEIEEMRAWDFRNAMPYELRQIEILQMLAINMNLVRAGELRNPFHHPPLCTMAFVQKRGNDGEPRPMQRLAHALQPDLHDFAPARQHQPAPQARPSDRLWLLRVSAHTFLHHFGIEYACRGQSLRLEGTCDFFPQASPEPASEWKREPALRPHQEVGMKCRRQPFAHGVHQQLLLAKPEGNRQCHNVFDDGMIQQHGAHFQTVGHTHRITIAKQPRLKMSRKIQESNSLRQVLAFCLICPLLDVFSRL